MAARPLLPSALALWAFAGVANAGPTTSVTPTCPPGHHYNGRACVPIQCGPGTVLKGGACVRVQAPPPPPAPAPPPPPPKKKSDPPPAERPPVDYSERAAQAIPVGGVGRLEVTPGELAAPTDASNVVYGYQNVVGASAGQRSTRLQRVADVEKVRDAAPLPRPSGGADVHRSPARDAPKPAATATEKVAAAPRLASSAPELFLPMNAKFRPPVGPQGKDSPKERATQLVVEGRRALAVRHEWQEAADKAADALRSEPADAEALILLSNAMRKLENCAAAEAHAREAIRLEPGRAEAQKALARALLCVGRREAALAAAKAASRLAPKDGDAWQLIGLIEAKSGRRLAAVQAYEEAARVDGRRAAQAEAARRGEEVGDLEFDDELAQLAESELSRGRRGGRLGRWLAAVVTLSLGVIALIVWRRRHEWFARPSAAVTAAAPAPGRHAVADKYETVRVLARTSAGEFLEVRDRRLGRTVALRRLAAHQDDERRSELLRAVRATGALRHPGLLDVYEVSEDGDDVCVVFEWVRGKTASRRVAESRRVGLTEAVDILEPVCEAVEFCHSRGLSRGRIALDCIVLTEQGPTKLADLDVVAGAGASGVRADVKALGECLYHLLTGAKAAPGTPPASRRAAGLPPAVDELISDAASGAGLASAADFLERLRALRAGVAQGGRV